MHCFKAIDQINFANKLAAKLAMQQVTPITVELKQLANNLLEATELVASLIKES